MIMLKDALADAGAAPAADDPSTHPAATSAVSSSGAALADTQLTIEQELAAANQRIVEELAKKRIEMVEQVLGELRQRREKELFVEARRQLEKELAEEQRRNEESLIAELQGLTEQLKADLALKLKEADTRAKDQRCQLEQELAETLRRFEQQLAATRSQREQELVQSQTQRCQALEEEFQRRRQQAERELAENKKQMEVKFAEARKRREEDTAAQVRQRLENELREARRRLEIQTDTSDQAAPSRLTQPGLQSQPDQTPNEPARKVAAADAAQSPAVLLFSMQPEQVAGIRVGDYMIKRLVAKTATSVVFEAVHEAKKLSVAMKMLAPDSARWGDRAGQFIALGERLAKLRHRNLASIYEARKLEDSAYCAREFVDGRNLQEIISAHEKPQPVYLLRLVRQIIDALGYLEKNNIPFGPLQPRHIVIESETGRAKLVGFSFLDAANGSLNSSSEKEMPRLARIAWNLLDFSAPGAPAVHHFLTRLMGRGETISSVKQMEAAAEQLEKSLNPAVHVVG